MAYVRPFDYSSPGELRAAVEAATDDDLGPALAALGLMKGRACTRADLLAMLDERIAHAEGN